MSPVDIQSTINHAAFITAGMAPVLQHLGMQAACTYGIGTFPGRVKLTLKEEVKLGQVQSATAEKNDPMSSNLSSSPVFSYIPV